MRNYASILFLVLGLGPPVLGQTPSSQQPAAPEKSVPAFAETKAPAPPPPPAPALPAKPAPVAPETLPPLPQQIQIRLVQDPTPPAQPVQAPAPQTQAFTISVTPAVAPTVATVAPSVATVTSTPATVASTPAIQTVSYPGPFSNLIGNIGEAMARAKMTRVVTYLPPQQIQVQALVSAPPVQAITATPQTVVRKHCFGWFQP